MVNREKDYGQTSNRIIDIPTFLSLGNSLKDLERYVNQIGRTLSDNERRLQQTLPGMIKTFEKVEKEVRASGKNRLNASQAADMKVMFANEHLILKWLSDLAKFNPKTGLARNDRNDKSFIQYGAHLDEIMTKLTNSLERSYAKWDTYIKIAQKAIAMNVATQKKTASAVATPTQQPATQNNPQSYAVPNNGINFAYEFLSKQKEELSSALAPFLEALERLGKLLNQGKITPGEARFRGYKVQTDMPSDLSAFTKAQGYSFYGQNAFTGSSSQLFTGADRYKAAAAFANIARKNQTYYTPPSIPAMPLSMTGAGRYAQYAQFAQKFRNYNPAPFPPKLSKKDLALYSFSQMGDILQNVHKGVGSVPILGKVTGFAAGASRSAGAMVTAGESLVKKFGDKGMLGKIGKTLSLSPIGAAIGATAFAVGAIYKQLKKSSPVLQAVSNIFELAWNLLWMPLGNALGTLLLPMAEDLINFAILFNELFTGFSFEKLMEWYYSALQLVWGAAMDLISAIPKMIIDGAFNMLIGLFDFLGWDGAVSVLEQVRDFIFNVLDFVRNLPTNILDGIRTLIKGVTDFFTNPVEKIKQAFSGILGGNVGKKVESGLKSTANNLLGWTGLKFATGGVVTGPTIAMIGEAGPEAVIPLDKAAGLGATYVININGDVYGVNDLESRIERVIQRTANKAYYR